ncbi:hypothetical protein B296_00006775 [Ensete ventricosum]|uniref:Uncharacterized protein n=1 Tax=Ensete ventricosum TaxID=4639 RepID=A0A427ALB2_ENSVE|nr:hypothetical protein B296_00006775 [Ensete ventricosum]
MSVSDMSRLLIAVRDPPLGRGERGEVSGEMVTLRTPDLLPSTWCPNETRRGDGALSSRCVGSGTTTALGFGVGSHPAPP